MKKDIKLSEYRRKTSISRRIVVTAVMIALSVTGRFIPFFKPITAITVISAVYLGPVTGFTVGAMSALISNFFFGQGPWTLFQMLAWGILGLIAGFMPEILKKNRIALAIYGVLSGIAYSFIMDIWSVLWYNRGFDFELYKAALITAVPYTVLYCISNLIFLLLLAKPFGDKLTRIKIKYGL